jgi:hypothetical protein
VIGQRRSEAVGLFLGCLLTVTTLLALASDSGVAATGGRLHTLVQPFSPSQQTSLAFGDRSHWLQPWRGYLQTVPAERLIQALGINFNPSPGTGAQVAEELAAAGFRRARIEVSWCRVSFDDPEHLTGLASLRTTLLELKNNHLRPLILLNANEGCPGPLLHLSVKVTAPAVAGARQITVNAASAAQIVPGHTGLDSTTKYEAAAILFTRVNGDTVTLSKPLPRALARGTYAASTLRYEPFSSPGDGSFEDTMRGWLDYVGLVTQYVRSVLGSQNFGVEVWNELSFGSDFLDVDNYYHPPLVQDALTATEQQILDQTVAYIRDPAHGVDRIGIGDGFSNERPWEAGSSVPAGVTSIDKHPYPPHLTFPKNAIFNGVRPLNALGEVEGWRDAAGHWHDAFVPSYTAFFPEYFLSGIQTETVIRDLSPITTTIYGTPHGRFTHPQGSAPPAIWLTEAGMDPAGIPSSVLPHFQAKEVLRWITAWVNKGAAAVYFYAAASPGWGLVDPDAPGGGQALRALHSLVERLRLGAGTITRPRNVRLLAVSDETDAKQFAGNGTAEYPALYDRDVIGFFPYQVSDNRVVIATYVMTRNLMRSYRPKLPASNPERYDMPPLSFRLKIGGVAGLNDSIAFVDPLTGDSVPASVLSRTPSGVVVDVPLTDYPRLLVLSAASSAPRPTGSAR